MKIAANREDLRKRSQRQLTVQTMKIFKTIADTMKWSMLLLRRCL